MAYNVESKYRNGKIYCIEYQDIIMYVGSTIRDIGRRMVEHKCRATKMDKQKLYKFLFEVGVENVTIRLLESYPCFSRKELHQREGMYIIDFKPQLNQAISGRSQKQYYIDNAEKIKDKVKLWRINNQDRSKETHKKYYIEHKDEIHEKHKLYYEQNYEQLYIKKRQWVLNNVEQVKEYHKNYQKENREPLKSYHSLYYQTHKNDKDLCECGLMVSRWGMCKHKKTATHISRIS